MNDDLKDFTSTLSFSDEITKQIWTNDVKHFDSTNDLSDSFTRIYDFEKNKLPYHINILDLLWANENAHSRIFSELLKQNSENTYDVLISFLTYLSKINPQFDQKPIKPRITSEVDRIDLLVQDKNFAVIIENKIHYAVDQGSQLARYIEKVKNKGFKESQIYVVYLTRDENRMPEDQSWRIENGNDYKDIFSERFFALSFKEDILPWLKDYVLPNCRVKDLYLKSTVEQYIDYLEGMFNLRKIDIKMNKELGDHIIKVLELTSTPEKNYLSINKKIEELNKVKDQLGKLKQLTEKECLRQWAKNIAVDFPSLDGFDTSNDEEYPKVGVKIKHNGMSFSVLIESDGDTIYYGIGRHYASHEILADVKSYIRPTIEGFGETGWWYGWKNTSFENGYSRLKSLIEEVIQFNK